MRYTPICGALVYVLSPDKKKVLMIHRNARPSDDHFGKYNGLGGKMEATEDPWECAKREVLEESGLECLDIELRGMINWTGFGKKEEDWLGFVYLVHSYQGKCFEKNHEGILEWVELSRLHELPMWEGDDYFLDLVFDGDPIPFHAYIPYSKGRPTSCHLHRNGKIIHFQKSMA